MLWTNPDSSQSMSPNTYNLDKSAVGYTFVGVIVDGEMHIGLRGNRNRCTTVAYSNGVQIFDRVVKVDDTTFTAEAGLHNGSTHNERAIPTYIVGIK